MKTETPTFTVSAGVLGRIMEIRGDGRLLVALEGTTNSVTECSQLQTADVPVGLAVGDRVLVWLPAGRPDDGVVLGRIGPSADPVPPKEIPDTLVIEARKGLVLRVGDGSITIRADGKILIKGKDLVSHAKRMNRIKGGAVSLN
ncbi:MAG: hypothetical protein ABI768_00175 [Acidobacteriota bacterium]